MDSTTEQFETYWKGYWKGFITQQPAALELAFKEIAYKAFVSGYDRGYDDGFSDAGGTVHGQ